MPRRGTGFGRSTAVMLAGVALAIAIAALVVALTRSSTTREVTAPTTATVPAVCSASASDLAGFVTSVHKQGNAAYQSAPANVTNNGTYTLLFGPLTPGDAARFNRSTSGGFSFPNLTDEFSPGVDRSRLTKVRMNGATYLRVPMVVTDFKAECAPLRALLQY